MKCPKCGNKLDEGRDYSAKPKYYWAGCDKCGLYQSARTEEELKGKLEPAERQEITSADVGRIEDILNLT